MNQLNKKVFRTIFIIISAFILFGIVVYNISAYKKEYNNVYRNLTSMGINKPTPNDPMGPNDRDLNNMIIMDYEVYTVKLSNSKIEKIISHSNDTSDFDVESIANTIIKKDNGLKIGNLYNNKYSYNYSDNTIVIMNTSFINKKLTLILIESIIILLIA